MSFVGFAGRRENIAEADLRADPEESRETAPDKDHRLHHICPDDRFDATPGSVGDGHEREGAEASRERGCRAGRENQWRRGIGEWRLRRATDEKNARGRVACCLAPKRMAR